MAQFTEHDAARAAADLIKAALGAGSAGLKLYGPSTTPEDNLRCAEANATFLATMVNNLADAIKTTK